MNAGSQHELQTKDERAVSIQQPEVVVITGASAGAGRAISRAFARQGAHIGLLARGNDGLEGARRDVEELGGTALAISVDVANAQQVEDAAERIERELARSTSGSTTQWCLFSRQSNGCCPKSTSASPK